MDRDLKVLNEALAGGVLVRPSDGQATLVPLIRALATLAGVGGIEQSPPVRGLLDVIGPAEHVIFILLDGLGMNTVRRLPGHSFISSSLKLPINASSPSTTACALTAIATAQHANRHSVTGWFTHLPEFGLTAVTLPF